MSDGAAGNGAIAMVQEPVSNRLEFRCPGQQHPISRAVHLGRLAAFYPACRQCSHRADTGTFSPRQVEQLQEVQASRRSRSLFYDEGAGGVYLNDLSPVAARDIAAAFGLAVQQDRMSADSTHRSSPAVVLAGDGRAIAAELAAAVAEGLRWSGCQVIDIGPATAACLGFEVHRLDAAGGILVGNPSRQPHQVGLQFWAAGARPLSRGGSLEPIIAVYEHGADRPSRNSGTLRREPGDRAYLAILAEFYHALRPLRLLIESASGPLIDYLRKLTATVACEVIAQRIIPSELTEQVRDAAVHFAVSVDGDGEVCRVFDEQGHSVPTERLLFLLAGQANRPSTTVVLESGVSTPTIRAIEDRGCSVMISGPTRAEMAAAMQTHRVGFGGGPSGRFWFAPGGVPLPDALMTITQVLILLSRSDDPLSAVLDREAAIG